ncbi:MAG: hypothetical protein IIX77_06555 [Oscillospiraceae bacterium]|nr:hypothetical protein [Oscillospiraceae bacterium]
MSLKNKLISAVLCAATLFGLAGCTFGKDFGTVVTVSGKDDKLEYGAGYYLYYQYSAFTGAASLLGAGPDTTVKEILKETVKVNDKDVAVTDYMKQQMDQYIKQHAAIDMWFEEEGLNLTAEVKADIQSRAKSGWDSYMGDLLKPNGVSYDTYLALVENYFKEQALYDKMFGEDAKDMLSETDIKNELKSDYLRAKVVKFPKVDANNKALSDSAKAEIASLVKSAVASVNSGSSMEKVVDEYMPKILKLSTGAEYTKASDYIVDEYIAIVDGNYSEAQVKAIQATEVDKADSLEDTRNIYCWQKQDVLKQDEVYKNQAEAAEKLARESAFEVLLKKYADGLTLTFNEEAAEYFAPKKIKY